jgi:hypothetical protein
VATALGAEGTGRAWTGLAASALVPMVAMVVILRGASEGLRAFGGPDAELRAYGTALWAAWLLVVLAIFGSVLRATTHHHGLAGVTFAFGALAAALGLGLTSARVIEILRGTSAPVRRSAGMAIGLVTVAALGWVGLRFLRAAHDPASTAAAGTIVDVLAFVLAAGFAARRTLASRRALAVVGPPVAVAIAALGFSALRDSPLRNAIDERAPAFAMVADVVPPP